MGNFCFGDNDKHTIVVQSCCAHVSLKYLKLNNRTIKFENILVEIIKDKTFWFVIKFFFQ